MKKFVLVLPLIAVVISAGAIRLLMDQKSNHSEARVAQAEVTANLEAILIALERKKDALGHFPAVLTEEVLPDSLGLRIDDFDYDPNAGEFDPLVKYRGDKEPARGYAIFRNGVVTSGKMKLRSNNPTGQIPD